MTFEFEGKCSISGTEGRDYLDPSPCLGKNEIDGFCKALADTPLLYKDHFKGPLIGKVISAKNVNGDPIATVSIDSSTEQGKEAIRRIKDHSCVGLSINIKTKWNEHTFYIDKRQIYELSLVEKPSFDECQVSSWIDHSDGTKGEVPPGICYKDVTFFFFFRFRFFPFFCCLGFFLFKKKINKKKQIGGQSKRNERNREDSTTCHCVI
jgi:hypothetical protein